MNLEERKRKTADFLYGDDEELPLTVLNAIGMLDGNEELIDWRDKNNHELLRKLCGHLEYFRILEDNWHQLINEIDACKDSKVGRELMEFAEELEDRI